MSDVQKQRQKITSTDIAQSKKKLTTLLSFSFFPNHVFACGWSPCSTSGYGVSCEFAIYVSFKLLFTAYTELSRLKMKVQAIIAYTGLFHMQNISFHSNQTIILRHKLWASRVLVTQTLHALWVVPLFRGFPDHAVPIACTNKADRPTDGQTNRRTGNPDNQKDKNRRKNFQLFMALVQLDPLPLKAVHSSKKKTLIVAPCT